MFGEIPTIHQTTISTNELNSETRKRPVLKNKAITRWFGLKPKQIKCLDCGFLALGDFEIEKTERILLHCDGSAGCPPTKGIDCYRALWVDEALTEGRPGNIFKVLKQERPCEFYFKYEPGCSPKEHKERQQRVKDRRFKLKHNLFGILIGSVFSQFINWLIK